MQIRTNGDYVIARCITNDANDLGLDLRYSHRTTGGSAVWEIVRQRDGRVVRSSLSQEISSWLDGYAFGVGEEATRIMLARANAAE